MCYSTIPPLSAFTCLPTAGGPPCSPSSSQLHLEAEGNFSTRKLQQLTQNGPLVMLEPLM